MRRFIFASTVAVLVVAANTGCTFPARRDTSKPHFAGNPGRFNSPALSTKVGSVNSSETILGAGDPLGQALFAQYAAAKARSDERARSSVGQHHIAEADGGFVQPE